MRRSTPRTLLALALAAMAMDASAAGCGAEEGLVGGDCASGYAKCGPHQCCPVDASLGDGSNADDGGDASYGDASYGDASYGDASYGDASYGDASYGDASYSDSLYGDSLNGDSSYGADGAPPGDVSTAEDSSTDEDGSSDASVDSPPLCTPPLVDCLDQCVDLTSDPNNCGSCGHPCPSQICVASVCVGSTSGGIVFIGHDYSTTAAGTSQARVLSNAVLMAEGNPLQVLSYERYALPASVGQVAAILNGAAQSTGRTFALTETSTDADIPNTLTIANYALLLVHDQPSAPTGALASLGASWMTTLVSFTQQGGIVIVLDGGSGVGQMPAFSTATSLLAVSAQASVTTGTPLQIVASGDAVGVGVVSPYGAGKSSVSLSTEPNAGEVVYVVETPDDAGTSAPVVIHKAF
jgi:hypothetical protein